MSLFLQLRDVGDPGAAEEPVGNGVRGHLPFAQVAVEFSVLGLRSRIGHGRGGDAPDIRAPSAARSERLGKHRVIHHLALGGHQILRHRAATLGNKQTVSEESKTGGTGDASLRFGCAPCTKLSPLTKRYRAGFPPVKDALLRLQSQCPNGRDARSP